MGLKIYWTDFAKNQLKNIYEYHKDKVSSRIAFKITQQIFEKVENLCDFPNIGTLDEHLINRPQVFRFIICTNYKIIYWLNKDKNRIEIFDIFDVRQSPKKIERSIIK